MTVFRNNYLHECFKLEWRLFERTHHKSAMSAQKKRAIHAKRCFFFFFLMTNIEVLKSVWKTSVRFFVKPFGLSKKYTKVVGYKCFKIKYSLGLQQTLKINSYYSLVFGRMLDFRTLVENKKTYDFEHVLFLFLSVRRCVAALVVRFWPPKRPTTKIINDQSRHRKIIILWFSKAVIIA